MPSEGVQNDESGESVHREDLAEPEVTSRRALLRGLGAATAAAVAGGVLSPHVAQAHGTEHQQSNNSDPAIHGDNTADGPGLEGTSASGPGVNAFSLTGPGVLGGSFPEHGQAGVQGVGNPGVLGFGSERYFVGVKA